MARILTIFMEPSPGGLLPFGLFVYIPALETWGSRILCHALFPLLPPSSP